MAAEDEDEVKRNFADALRAAGGEGGMPDGAMLIGWVIMAEWIDLGGNRYLTQMQGSSDGKELPEWQRDGYLLGGLKGGWKDEGGEE